MTLTVMCIPCGGSGREPLGPINVKCHVCKGVGSVPAPGAADKPAVPELTQAERDAQLRRVQQALVAVLDPVNTISLPERGHWLRQIREDLKRTGGVE